MPHLRQDEALRRNFFSRLKMNFFAGAGLSKQVWDGYRELANRRDGPRVPMITALGSTETAPFALMNVRRTPIGQAWSACRTGRRAEAGAERRQARSAAARAERSRRAIGARPDLTQSAFDEEGFIGSATRCGSPIRSDFAAGFEFDGRIAEDFKLVDWHLGQRRAAARPNSSRISTPLVARRRHRRPQPRRYRACWSFPTMRRCRALCAAPAAGDALRRCDPATRGSTPCSPSVSRLSRALRPAPRPASRAWFCWPSRPRSTTAKSPTRARSISAPCWPSRRPRRGALRRPRPRRMSFALEETSHGERYIPAYSSAFGRTPSSSAARARLSPTQRRLLARLADRTRHQGRPRRTRKGGRCGR